MSAASKSKKSVSLLTNLPVATTYKIKFGDNQYQFFTSGEEQLAVEVARQMKERESNVILYREDGTGLHTMSLERPPVKVETKKTTKTKRLTRAVADVDELFAPVAKNPRKPRRKAVRKATVRKALATA